MSDEITTAADELTQLDGAALDAVAKGTAKLQFEDAMRPSAAGVRNQTPEPEPDDEPTESADADTLAWLLAEAQHRLDNPDANTEAARHRVARRDAEAQTAAVTQRLEAMQRAQVDAQITAMNLKPAALWASGAKLADLLDDNGVPDAQKVAAAAEAAKEELGLAQQRPYSRPERLMSGASAPPRQIRDRWLEAFSPREKVD